MSMKIQKVSVVSSSTKGRKVMREQQTNIPNLFNPVYLRDKESVLAGQSHSTLCVDMHLDRLYT